MGKPRGREQDAHNATRRARQATEAAQPKQRVRLLALPSTEVRRQFGHMLACTSQDQDILITRHRVPQAVLMSAARYRALTGREWPGVEADPETFDVLYALMQSPAVQAGTARGVAATSAAMGKAAVTAAQRQRRTRPAGM